MSSGCWNTRRATGAPASRRACTHGLQAHQPEEWNWGGLTCEHDIKQKCFWCQKHAVDDIKMMTWGVHESEAAVPRTPSAAATLQVEVGIAGQQYVGGCCVEC
jgi:hypothetical protein